MLLSQIKRDRIGPLRDIEQRMLRNRMLRDAIDRGDPVVVNTPYTIVEKLTTIIILFVHFTI